MFTQDVGGEAGTWNARKESLGREAGSSERSSMHNLKIKVDEVTQRIFNAFMDRKIPLEKAVAQLSINARLSTRKLKDIINILKNGM